MAMHMMTALGIVVWSGGYRAKCWDRSSHQQQQLLLLLLLLHCWLHSFLRLRLNS
jgi:hypothetical protein